MAANRALYTVQEFIRDVVPMSRSTFYEEFRSGRLETVCIGRRRYVSVTAVRAYVASLVSAEADLRTDDE